MDKYEGSRLFLNIPADVAHMPNIKDKSILLFGEIYSMLNVTGKFYMSNKALAERLHCKPRTITDCVKQLQELGLINVKNVYQPNSKAIKGREITLNPLWQKNARGYSKEMLEGYSNNLLEGIAADCYVKEQDNKTENRTVKDIYSRAKPDSIADEVKTIVGYLNEKTKSTYRTTTRETKRLIKARLNEGFTVDDFKTVIDKKTAVWFNDTKMKNYLRPTTLFGPKFEEYLNEKVKGVPDQQNKNDPYYTEKINPMTGQPDPNGLTRYQMDNEFW